MFGTTFETGEFEARYDDDQQKTSWKLHVRDNEILSWGETWSAPCKFRMHLNGEYNFGALSMKKRIV